MTPTPPSTNSSNSGHSPDAQFRIVRKRNRVPLSCAPCRHRKLKCNRDTPCDNCIKRADSASCVYAMPAGRKRSAQSQSYSTSNSPDDMQNRIDRLEGLVLSLMTNGSQAAGPAAAAAVLSAGSTSIGSGSLGPNLDGDLDETHMLDDGSEDFQGEESDTEKVTKSFGIMKVDNENKKTFYIGEGHWAAILHDIAEVRNYFQTHKSQFEAQAHRVAQSRKDMTEDNGPALLFGAFKPPPREDIMSQLPSRYMSDILVARYFNTIDPATHILHGPTFQKQYNVHWTDPSKTSIVWVAMLFAILRISLLSYVRDGDEPPEFAGKCLDLSQTYRTQLAHCLILADYTKPHEHIIETLILHLHAEYRRKRDSEGSIWVLVGMIVRLAMRMGYHRDSKMFPNITPFQGEMRRRVWTFVRQADLLFSFQISLPSMIRVGDSDTELPRNLYDDEFNEESTVLPPSRPMSEPTTVSYMITKARLSLGFGRILEEVHSVRSKPYEEVLKIDRGLRDIYESIPDHLKLRPMSEQNHLPIQQISARFNIAAIYHKSQCVLHRRFLRIARNNPKYAHSRRTCLESAMAILEFQRTMHRETQPTGRMRNKKSWLTSLTANDFLLAATLLSMDLYLEKQRAEISMATSPNTNGSASGRSTSISEAYGWSMGMEHSQGDLLKALEDSRDIWRESRDESMEAYKASEILDLLLAQIKGSSGSLNAGPTYPSANGVGEFNGHVDEKQNAAMTLGLLSSGGVSPGGAIVGLTAQQSIPTQGGTAGFFDNKNASETLLQTGVGATGQPGNPFDYQGVANAPSPFAGLFGGNGSADYGMGMNLDWDAFDSYIQSSNLSLDPANSLWSASSPNSTQLRTTISSPDNLNETAVSGLNSNFYQNQNVGSFGSNSGTSNSNLAPAMSSSVDPLPQSSTGGQGNSGGEVFMGVSTPQPGGIPTWKWDAMNAKR